ncbi:MAG: histidinol phosphate phosphatase domain-containing protein [bacterium]|nr:histidinol phosphate phosphatase domain-containing protein [bacterium]
MIDLHTHSLFSDGELGPSELIRRAAYAGYKVIAITDHGDSSNLDIIIPNIVRVCSDVSNEWDIKAIPGIELTHVPPRLISDLTTRARQLGARLVVVHGETIAEPVCKGTNLAAIEAGVDILAHPGLLSLDEARLAGERGVCIEISGRKGHSLTNGHILSLSRKVDLKLVVNSDAHSPGDLMPLDFARKVALGAGMTEDEFELARKNAAELVSRIA